MSRKVGGLESTQNQWVFAPEKIKVFLQRNRAHFSWCDLPSPRFRVFLVSLDMRPTPRNLAILLLGLASILLGITFKLNHLMGAHTLFNVGVGLTVVGVALWVIQLVRGQGG
jgi:hypothetical protein